MILSLFPSIVASLGAGLSKASLPAEELLRKSLNVLITSQLNIQLAGEADQGPQNLKPVPYFFFGKMEQSGNHQVPLDDCVKMKVGENPGQHLGSSRPPRYVGDASNKAEIDVIVLGRTLHPGIDEIEVIPETKVKIHIDRVDNSQIQTRCR